MLVPSMWYTKVKFVFIIILLLLGIWCMGVLQNQQDFRAAAMVQLREFENRVGGAEVAIEGLKMYERLGEDKFVQLESRVKAKIKEMEVAKNECEVTEWSKSLVKKGFKKYSQNDEDGAIEAVFDFIGTTDKVYVEFGVESCIECNSRYLREEKGWNTQGSLLLDGGNENKKINLQKVIFWPDNIVQHFKNFSVKTSFDLLSVDTDSYDFFMMEAILEAGYAPRVIIVEYNANFEITEAKSIRPPHDGKSWVRWDGTTYQGMSLLAVSYLFNRFSYSLVWCNKVNCIGVRDKVLGFPLRRAASEFLGPRLDQHRCDDQNREMAVIGRDGTWNGTLDDGEGSPHIRCDSQRG